MAVMKWSEGRRDQTRKEVMVVRCGRSDIFSFVGAGWRCSTDHHYVTDNLQTHRPPLSALQWRRNGVCSPQSLSAHRGLYWEALGEVEGLTLPIKRNSVLHELFKNSTFNRSCTPLLNDLLLLTVQYQIGHDMWFYFMDSERNVNQLY